MIFRAVKPNLSELFFFAYDAIFFETLNYYTTYLNAPKSSSKANQEAALGTEKRRAKKEISRVKVAQVRGVSKAKRKIKARQNIKIEKG